MDSKSTAFMELVADSLAENNVEVSLVFTSQLGLDGDAAVFVDVADRTTYVCNVTPVPWKADTTDKPKVEETDGSPKVRVGEEPKPKDAPTEPEPEPVQKATPLPDGFRRQTINAAEAAKMLGMNYQTFAYQRHKKVKTGTIPYETGAHGKLIYKRADVLAYITQRAREERMANADV